MAERSRFLYRIQPARPDMLSQGPTAEEERVIAEHFSYLAYLTSRGVVLLTGRTLNTDSSAFGIVLLQTTSEKGARKYMQADPAVSKGVMRAELYPFRIATCNNSISKG